MLYRALTLPLHRAAQGTSLVLLQGPRGSGKTALLRREFPGHSYIALDDAAARALAREDPRGFLARLRGPAIVDDLHRAPELIQHLRENTAPRHLLCASARWLTLPNTATLELYRPTTAEHQRRPPLSLATLGRFLPAKADPPAPAPPWPSPRSFLECDVRDLVHVHDLDQFESFVQAARRRSGQLLDQQSLARECGVSHRTVVRWLGVLESCFLTIRVHPAAQDFGRRVIRRPKLHFLEGGGFESDVVSELYRNACHAGEIPDLRHWCDSNGLAIPLIVQTDLSPPVPVIIAAHPTPTEVTRLKRWMALAGVSKGAVIGQSQPHPHGGSILRYTIEQL